MKILNYIRRIDGYFLCKGGLHDWTSASQEGIRPTKEQMDRELEGFLDYAKMYCKREGCKKVFKDPLTTVILEA